MALTLQVIGQAGSPGTPFYNQVLGGLAAQVTAVLSEGASTPEHNARYLAARKCQLNATGYLAQLCVSVAQQLPSSYSSLAAVLDADIANALSAIWNGFAYSIVGLS